MTAGAPEPAPGGGDRPAASPWQDAALAAALFAVDPAGIGGVVLRARAGPVRDRWLAMLRDLLPADSTVRRVPVHVTDSRLLGGLDLSATLKAGRPIAERGLLAEADGGVLLIAMAERLEPATAAKLAAAMDTGEVVVERDGLGLRTPAMFGVVALDEGIAEDERPPTALADRLAFHLDLEGIGVRDLADAPPFRAAEIAAAREAVGSIEAEDAHLEALCVVGLALGVASIRAILLALRTALAAAALAGRQRMSEEDVALAARLVLAPRATRLPVSEADASETPETDQPQPEDPGPDDDGRDPTEDDLRDLQDIVLEAAAAAIPAGLLELLRNPDQRRGSRGAAGRAGARKLGARRGRPVGTRRGDLRSGARLDVLETLRTAAPWQPLRRRSAEQAGNQRSPARVIVLPEDFRVIRYKHRTETTAIFVVDASGSAALHRLAEAKGAVELLLADCYVRRDQVALIAFRGEGAELVLPPTRSLVRAKRSLAGLPGGGGTPLAAAIDAALTLALASQRKGQSPSVILLTDGRANVARDGSPGRARAQEEAQVAAREVRAAGVAALVVDTSPRPQAAAERLAAEMAARYLPLPYADAAALSGAVRAATENAEVVVT